MERCALVVGGSKGLGRATVLELARTGTRRIVVGYHMDDGGAATAAAEAELMGAEVISLQMGLDDDASLVDAREHLHERGWAVQHAVASAAMGKWEALSQARSRGMWRTIEVMGLPMITLARVFRRDLIGSGGGAMVGISSLGSVRTLPFYGAMGMAKATLETSARYLAAELAPYSVRVNIVRPWMVDTDSFRTAPAPEVIKLLTLMRTPMGRMLTPEDVARAVVWLLGDESASISGQVVTIDGGYGISA